MQSKRLRGLLLCVPLLWPAPALAQSVRAGIEAWQHADYTRAVTIWRPLAERGDADAAFNLGQAYRLGRGVKTNLSEAQRWLERAASKGHVDAQTTLGLLLFGNGDHPGGAKWLSKAADKGDPRAMLIYGTALFNGDGVPQDQVMGYAFVSRAAASGLQAAKGTLADMEQVMPVAQRKRGLAIAAQKAKSQPKPSTKPSQVAAARPPKASPKVERPQQTAATPAASNGKWAIQLGAFSKRSSAEALFRSLSSMSPVAGKSPLFIPVGSVTRLQVTGFSSRSDAAAACSALSKRGQACFPVAR